MRRLVFGITLAIGLVACGDSGKATKTTGSEIINGIEVPLQPETTTNDKTIAGVDSNNNGVRDDVERKIATDFGAAPANLAIAISHAKSLQNAIAIISKENSAAHLLAVVCSDAAALAIRQPITLATLNTPSRRTAYAEAFSGSLITDEGCKK